MRKYRIAAKRRKENRGRDSNNKTRLKPLVIIEGNTGWDQANWHQRILKSRRNRVVEIRVGADIKVFQNLHTKLLDHRAALTQYSQPTKSSSSPHRKINVYFLEKLNWKHSGLGTPGKGESRGETKNFKQGDYVKNHNWTFGFVAPFLATKHPAYITLGVRNWRHLL